MESDDTCYPVFDDRIVRLIVLSLPEGSNPRRKDLLPQVLREWAKNELQEHLSRESYAVIKERMERIQSVVDRARGLLEALEAIDNQDQWAIAMQMPRKAKCRWPKMERHFWWEWAETERFVRRIKDEKSFLAALSSAAPETWNSPKMRPPTIIAYLVLKDIAAMFEWCTGLEATRQVNRSSHEETGPFYQFAAAIWPVIFRKGEDRLPATIRNFSDYRESEGRALIANMAMRHRTWRLFED